MLKSWIPPATFFSPEISVKEIQDTSPSFCLLFVQSYVFTVWQGTLFQRNKSAQGRAKKYKSLPIDVQILTKLSKDPTYSDFSVSQLSLFVWLFAILLGPIWQCLFNPCQLSASKTFIAHRFRRHRRRCRRSRRRGRESFAQNDVSQESNKFRILLCKCKNKSWAQLF